MLDDPEFQSCGGDPRGPVVAPGLSGSLPGYPRADPWVAYPQKRKNKKAKRIEILRLKKVTEIDQFRRNSRRIDLDESIPEDLATGNIRGLFTIDQMYFERHKGHR